MTPVIIDIVLIGIVVICTYNGFRKGLILGIAGLLAIAISMYGANLIAETYSPEFTSMLRPLVSGLVNKSVDDAEERTEEQNYIYSGPEEGENDQVYTLSYESLRNLGILKTAAENISDELSEKVAEAGHQLKEALIEKLCSTIAYVLALVVFFILILIVFTVLANIVNLAFKLPGLELINELLGAALGFVKGMIFVFALAWVIRFLGVVLPEEMIDKTLVLGWLIKANPITALFGI